MRKGSTSVLRGLRGAVALNTQHCQLDLRGVQGAVLALVVCASLCKPQSLQSQRGSLNISNEITVSGGRAWTVLMTCSRLIISSGREFIMNTIPHRELETFLQKLG